MLVKNLLSSLVGLILTSLLLIIVSCGSTTFSILDDKGTASGSNNVNNDDEYIEEVGYGQLSLDMDFLEKQIGKSLTFSASNSNSRGYSYFDYAAANDLNNRFVYSFTLTMVNNSGVPIVGEQVKNFVLGRYNGEGTSISNAKNNNYKFSYSFGNAWFKYGDWRIDVEVRAIIGTTSSAMPTGAPLFTGFKTVSISGSKVTTDLILNEKLDSLITYLPNSGQFDPTNGATSKINASPLLSAVSVSPDNIIGSTSITIKATACDPDRASASNKNIDFLVTIVNAGTEVFNSSLDTFDTETKIDNKKYDATDLSLNDDNLCVSYDITIPTDSIPSYNIYTSLTLNVKAIDTNNGFGIFSQAYPVL